MGVLTLTETVNTTGLQSFPWYAWLLIGVILGGFLFHKYK
jgi:hypothetical protein